MKIVIDIDDGMYADMKECDFEFARDAVKNYQATIASAIINGTPLTEVVEDIKAEIKKNILDEPAPNGTNGEMACYNGGLLKCLEIIDKHISGEGSKE